MWRGHSCPLKACTTTKRGAPCFASFAKRGIPRLHQAWGLVNGVPIYRCPPNPTLHQIIMPKSTKKELETLKGWNQIATFLGEPTSVVQRWASEGMPIRREGRFVSTSPRELNAWLGKESGKPVHVATEDTDLTAELKRGLSFVRQEKPQPAPISSPTRKANSRSE